VRSGSVHIELVIKRLKCSFPLDICFCEPSFISESQAHNFTISSSMAYQSHSHQASKSYSQPLPIQAVPLSLANSSDRASQHHPRVSIQASSYQRRTPSPNSCFVLQVINPNPGPNPGNGTEERKSGATWQATGSGLTHSFPSWLHCLSPFTGWLRHQSPLSSFLQLQHSKPSIAMKHAR